MGMYRHAEKSAPLGYRGKRRMSGGLTSLVELAIGLTLIAGLIGCAAVGTSGHAAGVAPTATWVEPTSIVSPSPTSAPATPEIGEFRLTPRIKERHCFSSAGCNITFVIDAGWSVYLSPDATWELTYEVTGVEDGPLIDTLEITGDQYEQSEISAGTPKPSTKLKVKAISINRLGL